MWIYWKKKKKKKQYRIGGIACSEDETQINSPLDWGVITFFLRTSKHLAGCILHLWCGYKHKLVGWFIAYADIVPRA